MKNGLLPIKYPKLRKGTRDSKCKCTDYQTALLTDEIRISGSLLPDEEVDLSFETSGKIVEINFDEGSTVQKGQLLAKVNDRQLQAHFNVSFPN